MATIISLVALGISLLAAYFAWRSVKVAREAKEQAAVQQYYSTFNIASKEMMQNPEFLYSVHGLDRGVPVKDTQYIAYLGLLMDNFQFYYDLRFKGDFKRMSEELTKRPTFLTNILAVPDNQKRWAIMKKLFYSNFDAGFVETIDSLIYNINKQVN